MKSIVVYFSQTGNTRKVARAIHKGMSQMLKQGDTVEIKEIKPEGSPVKEIEPQDLVKYDLIGLGSPVWGAEPRIVRRFINNIPYSERKHIFSFNTHAELRELYFPIVTRRLKSRGLTVIGMGDWYGGSNVQCFPYPSFTTGHPDEIDLKEAEEFGKEMIETSRRISAGETHLIPPEVPYPDESTFKKAYDVPSDRSPHGTIRWDKEKCLYPKCRLCVDNCPNGFIDLDYPPLFGDRPHEHKCEAACVFCELICPTGAIYGEDWDFGLEVCRRNLKEVSEIMDKAEAEGCFRRLVPADKLGWDTPFYKVFNKHPRYKVPKGE